MTLLDVVPIPPAPIVSLFSNALLFWCVITILTAIVAVIIAVVLLIVRKRRKNS